ncbi:hypothetical protein D9758_018736 [Tetrapyrgos nigripes]|uniref:Uncharacterized protein n=1 Tax=Tetrapyrgos nigripes TaxID=182062 RepID=A0A8H5FEG6_9AGAR|nr:hypothetical protein D9758_018736 [Tetrapyrgos nigripes]
MPQADFLQLQCVSGIWAWDPPGPKQRNLTPRLRLHTPRYYLFLPILATTPTLIESLSALLISSGSPSPSASSHPDAPPTHSSMDTDLATALAVPSVVVSDSQATITFED